jgi:predicted AAA+ superfamily ATPase
VIQRNSYLEKLQKLKDKDLIKVITGVRRCGKSTILEIYRNHLLENGINTDQIIEINFESAEYDFISDYKILYNYVKERLVLGKQNYVFLDEIQNVKHFEKAVDSLYIMKNVDLYLTGSNAYLLSGELATLLSGRYIKIEMQPLSFKEYVSVFPNSANTLKLFADYQQFSSFPYAINFDKDKKLVRDYLDGIYNTIVIKDVVTRNKISDVSMLESVVKFMADNIGNICSIKKISDTMTSDGRRISTHTVESYIKALVDSYVLYKIGRYDIKGKQYLKTGEKYYICDIGIRRYLLGEGATDSGRVLENIIYLELLNRGYNVYVGKTGTLEVDFIASNEKGTEYYQVAETVRQKETLERELKSLDNIRDHNPKYLITLDYDPPKSHNGIKQINAIEWLLEFP